MTTSIADATEIFLQTAKNHAAQRVTWSNCKHHNTTKVLITISPNGLIVFASEGYGGSISDKQLTLDSGYLDSVEPYTEIMVDKGFNIKEERTACFMDIGQLQRLRKQMTLQNYVFWLNK